MQTIRYLSLCSGIGGFELGIEHHTYYRADRTKVDLRLRLPRSGHLSVPHGLPRRARCVGFSEIDPHAKATYQTHFNNHADLGDIKGINEGELPDFDLLCCGFPCQSFSIAGNRQGLRDPRGALFFDIARIIKAKRPPLLLLENVKGFLSHENGHTAQACFRILDELGYDIQWQVLNSKNFGVPQNRERIFIVGHLRDQRRPQVFPFTQAAHQTSAKLQGELDSTGKKYTLRRLTPLECERVQGFPDDWTRGLADTNRYRCLGNAVSPPVVAGICGRLFRRQVT